MVSPWSLTGTVGGVLITWLLYYVCGPLIGFALSDVQFCEVLAGQLSGSSVLSV